MYQLDVPSTWTHVYIVLQEMVLRFSKLASQIAQSQNSMFRQYGLWTRYADLYPHNDLVYTVGVNDYSKDWFFAHVTRRTGNTSGNTYQPTTWQIIFELQNNILRGTYTLQLALASATESEVEVWFNDPSANPPHFTTGQIGENNAIARHGIHGLHRLYSIDVPSDHLVKGKNTIYLKQSRTTTPFQRVM